MIVLIGLITGNKCLEKSEHPISRSLLPHKVMMGFSSNRLVSRARCFHWAGKLKVSGGRRQGGVSRLLFHQNLTRYSHSKFQIPISFLVKILDFNVRHLATLNFPVIIQQPAQVNLVSDFGNIMPMATDFLLLDHNLS